MVRARWPLSITARMPGRVTLDSPRWLPAPRAAGPGGRMRRAGGEVRSRSGRDLQARASAAAPASADSGRPRVRSRAPGRNTSTSPPLSVIQPLRRRRPSVQRVRRRGSGCTMRTGKLRPALVVGSAKPGRDALVISSTSPTSPAGAGPGAAWTARPRPARRRVARRWRSWRSSNRTAPMPASSGSSWIRRVRMPSVTTSMRVAADTRLEADAVADRRRRPPRRALARHEFAAAPPGGAVPTSRSPPSSQGASSDRRHLGGLTGTGRQLKARVVGEGLRWIAGKSRISRWKRPLAGGRACSPAQCPGPEGPEK